MSSYLVQQILILMFQGRNWAVIDGKQICALFILTSPNGSFFTVPQFNWVLTCILCLLQTIIRTTWGISVSDSACLHSCPSKSPFPGTSIMHEVVPNKWFCCNVLDPRNYATNSNAEGALGCVPCDSMAHGKPLWKLKGLQEQFVIWQEDLPLQGNKHTAGHCQAFGHA